MSRHHKKTHTAIVASMLVLLFGIVLSCQDLQKNNPSKETSDLQNLTLNMMDMAGHPAKLVNGSYEGDHLSVQVLHTASADFNRDGLIDGVLIVWVNSGGSGNFRELCLILNNGNDLVQTDKAFLGDRIKIANLKVDKNTITVNYLDRGAEDAFAVKPYIKKKVQYLVREMKLESVPESQR
jgi:hypothetical protein